ncbi:hypothetical protein WKI71_34870 [Streptomyces sp. MS1.AVA.1]|uniref:Uncharacterized protein n=1 Tax=Streptomyces machairae TaxID=3134109 RepID=A0ABU8UST8_9ACTN
MGSIMNSPHGKLLDFSCSQPVVPGEWYSVRVKGAGTVSNPAK